MRAKVSDLAARTMIHAWYAQELTDETPEMVQLCTDEHFPPKEDDVFDLDYFKLHHHSDGWYVAG